MRRGLGFAGADDVDGLLSRLTLRNHACQVDVARNDIGDIATAALCRTRRDVPLVDLAEFELDLVHDLVGILGHFSLVSVTLNAFQLPLPDGEKVPFDLP